LHDNHDELHDIFVLDDGSACDSLDDGFYDLFLMMNCIILLIWWTWIHNITLFNDELAWYKCYNDELRNVLMMLLLVNLIMMLNCIQYLYNLSYLMMFTSASWTHDFFEDELHDELAWYKCRNDELAW